MLTYSFSDIGSKNLYEHLYKEIKEDILSGKLRPMDKLPSKRTFAKNLGISTITVENSYAQLMAEGYIYSLPKKGYFVSQISNVDTKVNIKKSKKTSTQTKEDSDKFIADFVNNSTKAENFPFSIWAKLLREVISSESESLMKNSPAEGIYTLREAIAGHLYDFRGMNVSPDQIIIGAGTEYLYSLLVQLLGHDKIYAVEDPGYKKIAKIYESNSVKCEYLEMDEKGIITDLLEESKADIIHISPSHHYPSGIITPISRRYELLGWASRDDKRFIIEDDFDCEFRLLGKPIPTLQSIDVSEKVIYMNTFSKSLSSTIRISYMILPPNLLEKFHEKLGFYSCTVSTFEQYTLSKFISEGYFEKHINRMRNYYRNLRDLILLTIKENSLSSKIKIKEEDSGLHFLMILNTEKKDEEIVSTLLKRGIRVSCLSEYYHNYNKAFTHTLIINYSAIDEFSIKEAINIIGECI